MSAAVHATDPSLEPAASSHRLAGPLPRPAVEVRALYRGITTHARILTFPNGARARQRGGRQFTIGWQSGVDAPVADGFVPWAAHPLVLAAGGDYVVNVTPQMTGEVRERGLVYSLAAYTERRGRTFSLPPSGEATLECGDSQFVIARTTAPRALPAPRWRWSWQRHGYTLAAGLALAMFLIVIAFVPEDPKSLALDIFGRDGHRIAFTIKPPVEEPPPPWLITTTTGQNGGRGSAAPGPSGAMGDKTAPRRDARFSIRRRANETELRLSQQQAVDTARSAGVLGVMKRMDSSPVASIFSRDSALGDSAADVLGHLQGPEVANAYEVGGLTLHGSGAQGGGQDEGILGVGRLNTIGPGDGTGAGPGRGRMVGTLGPRAHTRLPEVLPGIGEVRGSLDKNIIRRIIRLHLNEVKYCYEQELTRKPALGGRVVVHFAISAAGQVLTSALQSSTMGNATVENCTVQAVKRWQFPAPEGGGLVVVSYPFVLSPAGG